MLCDEPRVNLRSNTVFFSRVADDAGYALLCGGKKLKHGFLIIGSFGESGVI